MPRVVERARRRARGRPPARPAPRDAMRNLLTRVPRSAHRPVATLVRSIFDQADSDAVHDQYQRVLAQLEERFPAAAPLLEDAGADLLAFTAYPPAIWRQLWSNNPIERLNKEIRRRTD